MKSSGLAVAIAVPIISAGAVASAGSTARVRTASRCVSHGGLPDRRCTPGAVNAAVTQSTINRTISVSGWTQTVRPPTSYTNRLKVQGIVDYGYADKRLSSYEEDHLIPLAVGGSPRSPENLWPERYAGKWGARVKDKLERYLQERVCDGTMRLSRARRQFRHWKAAFERFGL